MCVCWSYPYSRQVFTDSLQLSLDNTGPGLDHRTPRKGRSLCVIPSPRQIPSLWPALCLYALVGLCLWVYWPGLDGPFLFDDFSNLSPLDSYGEINDSQGLIRYLGQGIAGPTGRPISMLSFLLNVVSWPSQPWAFKYTNLLIHVLNGVLVFWCGLKICRLNSLPLVRGQAEWLALASAAIWLLHPVQVSTTLYVIQRMAMLAALFSLGGILLYVHGRETLQTHPKSGYAVITLAVGLCTLLAVFSKENGALLPLLLAVVEFTVLRHQSVLVRHPHRNWTLLFFALPTFAAAVYLGRFLLPYQVAAYAPRGFTAFERGLTEGRILLTYLYDLAIPKLYSGSLFNDDYPISTGLANPPTTLLALAVILLLLGMAYRVRKTYPLVSLAVLFFFVGHLLESTVTPLDLYYEHRNYLPSVFLFLPLAYAVENHRKILLVGVLSFLLLCAGFTAAKAKLWSNEGELTLFWATQHPHSVRAQREAANIYYRMGMQDKAVDVLRATTRQHPEDFRLRLHLMNMSCVANQQPDVENLNDVLQQVKTNPVYFDSRDFDLLDELVSWVGESKCPGLSLDKLTDITDSIMTNPAVKDSRSYQYLLNHIKGEIALQAHDGKTALEHFATALKLSGDAETGLLESALLASHGFYPEALQHLQLSENLLHSNGQVASGVFAKHDFPMEIERMRKNIREDMAHQLAPKKKISENIHPPLKKDGKGD